MAQPVSDGPIGCTSQKKRKNNPLTCCRSYLTKDCLYCRIHQRLWLFTAVPCRMMMVNTVFYRLTCCQTGSISWAYGRPSTGPHRTSFEAFFWPWSQLACQVDIQQVCDSSYNLLVVCSTTSNALLYFTFIMSAPLTVASLQLSILINLPTRHFHFGISYEMFVCLLLF